MIRNHTNEVSADGTDHRRAIAVDGVTQISNAGKFVTMMAEHDLPDSLSYFLSFALLAFTVSVLFRPCHRTDRLVVHTTALAMSPAGAESPRAGCPSDLARFRPIAGLASTAADQRSWPPPVERPRRYAGIGQP